MVATNERAHETRQAIVRYIRQEWEKAIKGQDIDRMATLEVMLEGALEDMAESENPKVKALGGSILIAGTSALKMSQYLDYMTQDDAWGGQFEIWAYAQLHQRDIITYQKEDGVLTSRSVAVVEDDEVKGTLYLYYHGRHYGALMPVDK